MAPPNKYSSEFRDEAVQLAVNSGKSVTAVARELGINSETLRSWVREHERDRDQSEAPASVSERARMKELEPAAESQPAHPVRTTFDEASRTFRYTFPPHSVTVMRIKPGQP